MDIEDMSIKSIKTFLKKKEEESKFTVDYFDGNTLRVANSNNDSVLRIYVEEQCLVIYNDDDGHWEDKDGKTIPNGTYFLKKGCKEE